jgi:hypothetical protein
MFLRKYISKNTPTDKKIYSGIFKVFSLKLAERLKANL